MNAPPTPCILPDPVTHDLTLPSWRTILLHPPPWMSHPPSPAVVTAGVFDPSFPLPFYCFSPARLQHFTAGEVPATRSPFPTWLPALGIPVSGGDSSQLSCKHHRWCPEPTNLPDDLWDREKEQVPS